MKAVGYARVSTTEQVDGSSLQAQEAQIRAYGQLRGLDIVAVLVDAGVSGGKSLGSRPEGRKVRSMIDAGLVNAVVIAKLDRGFRSASDCLNNVEAWERKGISLHILNLGGQTIDTGSAAGKFFITVMAGAAELERNLIRERCNEGRKARKAQGRCIGGVPYGYRLDVDGKTLLEAPEEQAVIERIRQLRNKGRTLREIAVELTHDGIGTKKGNSKWTHVQVGAILKRAA